MRKRGSVNNSPMAISEAARLEMAAGWVLIAVAGFLTLESTVLAFGLVPLMFAILFMQNRLKKSLQEFYWSDNGANAVAEVRSAMMNTKLTTAMCAVFFSAACMSVLMGNMGVYATGDAFKAGPNSSDVGTAYGTTHYMSPRDSVSGARPKDKESDTAQLSEQSPVTQDHANSND